MSDSGRKEIGSSNAKPARHPKDLSAEYHKAHKQLMLWSGILFIWELVGIDLGEAKEAGGNVGPIVKALRSPQAVPWVLLLLVLYFLFKCSVEWGQCHLDRRRLTLARIDFISALIVSGSAISLYVGQTISRVQFADIVQSKTKATFGLVYGLVSGVFLISGLFLFQLALKKTGNRGRDWALGAILTAGAIFLTAAAFRFGLNKLLYLIGFLIASGLIVLMIRFRLRKLSVLPKNS